MKNRTRTMKKRIHLITLLLAFLFTNLAYGLDMTRDQMIHLTRDWQGERYKDGRPKVPQDILDRMKSVSLEEAWGVLRGAGYTHQFEGKWSIIHPDQPVVGRALTAFYLPGRPDLDKHISDTGKAQGRIGGSNSWPIDMLMTGDVYVADGFGKITDGTLIGDNLGNAIFAKSGNGVVFNGSVRDLEGLEEIKGFNAFVKGWDPSAIKDMTLGGVNTPIRLGNVTVLPGDVVLAKREGVIFIPPHLAEKVVVTSEVVRLKDQFGHMRLKEGRYTPGEIDRKWSEQIKKDFLQWLDDQTGISAATKAQVQKGI